MKVMLLFSMTFITSCSLIQNVSDRATIPSRYPLGQDLAEVMQKPQSWGLSLQSFSVATSPGQTLAAIMVRCGEDCATMRHVENVLDGRRITSKATVFLFHGINARKEQMLGLCQWYVAAGFQCVVFDSRGHGDSSVARATYGRREVGDFLRLMRETERKFGDLGHIVFHGNSMGAAVALQCAPKVDDLRAIVATSTFASLYETMKYQASKRHLSPLLPIVRRKISSDAEFDPRSITPANDMRVSSVPVLLIHGSADQVIPISTAKKTQRIIGYEQCRLITVQGAGHNDAIAKGGDALMKLTISWAVDRISQ